MIPNECKRLAEVDFPIDEVSKHAAREKSIRHGHPSTLHMWWARRPLASSRAILIGLLLPDPCDEHCPETFKKKARRILLSCAFQLQGWQTTIKSDEGLRRILLKFIADFANWDLSADSHYLDVSRALVKAAHDEDLPLVVDPFAGGGSIPLEALRLGCEVFASDLNPVACLILKTMLEDIPRHGPKLAENLRKIGDKIKQRVMRKLADFYPIDPDGAIPVAYLWARTVQCEAPNCGSEIPLMHSFWLCRKPKRKWALRYKVVRQKDATPQVELDVFEPTADKDVPLGTVKRARATCVCCGAVLPPERVRAQLAAERGGADVVFNAEGKRVGGARMTAVVTIRPREKGRHYRLPVDADYDAVRRAHERATGILDEWERSGGQGFCPMPDESTPTGGGAGAGRAFSIQRYGMLQWKDLFTVRQRLFLMELSNLVATLSNSETAKLALAMVVGRCASYGGSGVMWVQEGEFVANTFGRQALPIVWDFAEAVQLADSSGNFEGAVDWVARVVKAWPGSDPASTQQANATIHPLADQAAGIWFTDPPYYDAVPYADLSDFFLVWLKRALSGPLLSLLQDPSDTKNPLSPKTAEAVQDETKYDGNRPKDRDWFEETMMKAFAEGRRVLREDGVGSVVFAHKTTEGWEALLSGMIGGGWTITASWPIATERPGRLRAQESAALSTSVHLVCRPRSETAPVGDWGHVLRELPSRVRNWIERLQSEGIRGADLIFACIGPALEIFSRYQRVETADGRQVGLAEYLEKVWEVIGHAALEQVLGTGIQTHNDLTGALEEDARLTALFLWTLQTTETSEEKNDDEAIAKVSVRGFKLPFDVVRCFAQPMGIDLDDCTGHIILQEKGSVRLLPVMERAKHIFGEDGVRAVAGWIENDNPQGLLFSELDTRPKPRNRRRGRINIAEDVKLQKVHASTLDRVHAAMLLQSSGHSNALRKLIATEQDRGPEFLRLANALSALYPRGCSEKRLLDAMLLAVPR